MKRLAAYLLFTAAVAVVVAYSLRTPDAPAVAALSSEQVDLLLQRARTWLARRQLDESEAAALQILTSLPQHPEALLVVGEIAMRRGDFVAARRSMEAIDDSSVSAYAPAQYALGEVARTEARLSAAEGAFRRSIASAPGLVEAQHGLAFVLNISARRWEASPVMLQELAHGDVDAEQLALLGDSEQLFHNAEYIARCRQVEPTDPLPLLALAAMAMGERRWSEAHKLLDQVITARPDLMEAQWRMGRVLYECGDDDAFLRWNANLPPEVERHPELWTVRGSWLRSEHRLQEAMRCAWEAVRLDPSQRVAVQLLAQLCQKTGRDQDATALLPRAERLQALADQLTEIHRVPTDGRRMAAAARLTAELGRWWEARAWAIAARRAGVADESLERLFNSAAARLTDMPTPATREVDLDPAFARLDFSDCPLPDWTAAPLSATPPAQPTAATHIRFSEEQGTGLEFQYFNGADPSTEGMRMLEGFGGGVGTIDYDRDGWTDLYWTQGSIFPSAPGAPVYLDQLFRNSAGRRWQELAAVAGIFEDRFSTGVGVGDFDSDGFADVYVGNIGRNRLWRNNGDGTFTDASDAAGLTADAWTTSCALADLDGDGLADIYDVNYLQGDALHSLICQENGVSRACRPTVFDPAPDDVWRNLGDGRVDSGVTAWNLRINPQNGLGILVADLDGSGAVDLFIANDAVPNSYYSNLSAAQLCRQPTTDTAVLAGLAFDRDGKPQACMGVAAGDADADGRLDLFITNYYDESNTMYRQSESLQFVDDSAALGLRAPSLKRLGFGTQFLDADLDGREDLVLVNGHVDDFSYQGTPYRMRPQFFGQREESFEELFPDSLGEWFGREQLGRSLARLDWNRDGRPDFAVSHLDTSAALVTNHTMTTAHFVSFRLVGVDAHRDAVGAILTLHAGGRMLVRHLSGGDGYQSSNERFITFGLGDAAAIERLEVQWPGGAKQTVKGIAADTTYMLIQNQPLLPESPRR